MSTLQLNDQQAAVLRQVLESYLREVSGQISNTDKFEMREELKQDRDVVRKIVDEL